MKNTVIAACFLLASCQSADHISRFSTAALTGIKQLDQQPFHFTYYCSRFSEMALRESTDSSLFDKARSPHNDCSTARNADSVLALMNDVINTYLSSLQALADPKLIDYKARSLTNAIADLSPSLAPSLDLTDDKKAAVKDLLEVIVNEPLKAYRLNRLLRMIRRTDSAFGRVLSAYETMLSPALSGEIDQTVENYKSFVYTKTYGWARTPVEKIWANTQYRDFKEQRAGEMAMIRKEIRVMETIRAGHHELATHASSSGFKEVETVLVKDIVLIDQLITDIHELSL